MALLEPAAEASLSDIVQGAAGGEADGTFTDTVPLFVARVNDSGSSIILCDGENSAAATLTAGAQERIPHDALPLDGRRVRVGGYAEKQDVSDNAPIILHIEDIRVLPGARAEKPRIEDLVDVAYNLAALALLAPEDREAAPAVGKWKYSTRSILAIVSLLAIILAVAYL